MKLKELAEKIGAHLKRFEADPVLSLRKDGKSARFWGAGCGVAGRYVSVTYISYQGQSTMTKAEAEAYLSKLDAGFVGRHFEALRKP
jgi:hypothetical protein